MNKYVIVKIGTIVTQIAKKTNVKGYTEGILETHIPNEMTEKGEIVWIKENNKRMSAICKFLNENNL